MRNQLPFSFLPFHLLFFCNLDDILTCPLTIQNEYVHQQKQQQTSNTTETPAGGVPHPPPSPSPTHLVTEYDLKKQKTHSHYSIISKFNWAQTPLTRDLCYNFNSKSLISNRKISVIYHWKRRQKQKWYHLKNRVNEFFSLIGLAIDWNITKTIKFTIENRAKILSSTSSV